MRRFLINCMVVTANGTEIENLGLGCEMWEQGPVAVVSTLPPYQACWFLDLASLKNSRFDLPGPVDISLDHQIDLFMLDEQDMNYWVMLTSKFGIATAMITPTLDTRLLPGIPA